MEQQQYEVIDVVVTDPASSIFKDFKNDKATCAVIKCSNRENCQLYARGECSFKAILGRHHCAYGKIFQEDGYTKAARRYSAWRKEKLEQYKPVGAPLKQFTEKMALVGELVFLPYSYLNMNKEVPFKYHGSFLSTGSGFLPVSAFTVYTILKIVEFRPHALMGGEITKYQKEVVPKFLIHLKELFPELYTEVVTVKPSLADKAASLPVIGRKALISTLAVGCAVKDDNGTWEWDGTFLTSTDASLLFTPVAYDNKHIVIKPKDNATVKITDESQVTESTVFTD